MTSYVILSPHLDDAVLSCGGTIARLATAGEHVTVITFFAGATAPPFSRLAVRCHRMWGSPPDVVRLRRAEDGAAVARLGAETRLEELPDAIYRRGRHSGWLYRREAALWGAVHAEDDWIVTYLIERLRTLIHPDSRLYAPLAFGRHVDHVLTFQVASSLVGTGHDVRFYEDFPYAAVEAAYRRRARHLAGWTSSVSVLEPAHLTAKIEAFSYYRSQLSTLFDDTSDMVARFTAWAEKVGGTDAKLGERFWRSPDQ